MRRRLLELNMFPDPKRYLEFWNEADHSHFFDQSNMPERINFIRQQHRTIRRSNFHPIMAEVIFRAEYMHEIEEKMLRGIKEAVKITGPLNRPPVNLDVWHQWNSIRNVERRLFEARHARLSSLRRAEAGRPCALHARQHGRPYAANRPRHERTHAVTLLETLLEIL